ncbi:MAG: amidohydrolase family protein, partial [Gemmatimonadetes bacterium]|nr:amidohydrolase family protein [Gemmatimonadota bacterium]
ADAALDYAPGWPGIEGIDGEVRFEGPGLRILVPRGRIFGVDLVDVVAEVPDLDQLPSEIMTITGRARGPTAEFLRFVSASPVSRRIDGFTDGMVAEGRGELELELVMPLRATIDSRVQGEYRFADNRIALLEALPPLEAARGRLRFTADTLSIPEAQARLFGNPLRLSAQTGEDGTVRFRAAGRVWTETNKEKLLTTVVDSLVKCGVTMLPTRVVYEANRDVIRATSLPWHGKYTHQALLNWNYPNPAYHGSYHFDWTSDDEANWNLAYALWGQLIFEFNKRGGRVAFGTDDNYIWATPGFGTVRELQLLRETGMHSLEVLRSATRNSAETLLEPKLGLVRPGYKADLAIVDGNPAANLKFMYAFGDLTLDKDGKMVRTTGVVHTIKDGIVMENANLMREVEAMVRKSKAGVSPVNVISRPFLPAP